MYGCVLNCVQLVLNPCKYKKSNKKNPYEYNKLST